jgi:hypothetical protein
MRLVHRAAATSVANMAGDGTNSASAFSLSFCFGRNTIGHKFLRLAFKIGIKLYWAAWRCLLIEFIQ